MNKAFVAVMVMLAVGALCTAANGVGGNCIKGDCQHGFGIMVWPDGTRYEGQWKGGRFHGQGMAWRLDGEWIYEGDFVNGMPHGVGREVDGVVEYRGVFKNGLRHGSGVLIKADGSRVHGRWEDGEYVGK